MLTDTRPERRGRDKSPVPAKATNLANFTFLGHHTASTRRDTDSAAKGVAKTETIVASHATQHDLIKVASSKAAEQATVEAVVLLFL